MGKSAISPRPTPEFEISSDFFENKIYNSIVLFFCKKKKIVVEKSWKKPSTGFTNNISSFFWAFFPLYWQRNGQKSRVNLKKSMVKYNLPIISTFFKFFMFFLLLYKTSVMYFFAFFSIKWLFVFSNVVLDQKCLKNQQKDSFWYFFP